MGLFWVLILSFGAFCSVCAADCIPETARCSVYWERIFPHKDFFATEDELDSWCSKQTFFYECLEDVLLEGKNGNLSYLPTNLLISKLFAQDICTDGSTSRRRLLDNAECINQLNTDFCILPEYLDIVTPDEEIPSTRCSQAEKSFSCVAATMVLNCGFDAGRAFRTMLKITRYSDEICGIEMSEGIPPCESHSKSSDRNEKLSETYYGLFHRIGNILNEEQTETHASVSEQIQTANADELVIEAIQSAVDSLDENTIVEECDSPECLHSTSDVRTVACSKDESNQKPYMAEPIITEVFKGILFYNYSGMEFAVYWRQPEFTVFDTFNCEHLAPSYMKVHVFRCKVDYRYNDPDCITNVTNHETITPEFIREFDPELPCNSGIEFGPRPEWMKQLDQLYEERRVRDQMKQTTSFTQTEAPGAFTTSSTLLHLASTISSNNFDEKWYEYDFRAHNLNSPLPNDIHLEIADLLMPDMKSFVPPPMNRIKIGDSLYFIMYNAEFAESMENITCSRIDECHPKGRGLWKCKIWPRKIETCDTCGKIPTEDSVVGIEYARPATPSDAVYTMVDMAEPTVTESGVLENSATTDSLAFIYSGDTESGKILKLIHPENEVELNDDFNSLNDEASSEDDFGDAELNETDQGFNLDSLSENDDEVQLQMLSNILNAEEGSESSELVYEIDGTYVGDNDSDVVIATEDGLISGKILLVHDLSDLDEAKYTIVSTPNTDDSG